MSGLPGSILRGRRGPGAILPRGADEATALRSLDAPRRAGTAPRPSAASTLLWVLLLPLLVLVQVTGLTFLPVPWAVPDLVLVTVLGLAHHRGPVAGGLLGAWAGLLLDVVPPASAALGGWTLVLGVVGAVHGHVVATRRPGPLLALALFAVSAGATTLGHALVLWFSGVTVAPEALLRAVVGAGAWALALSPLALLLTGGRIGVSDPTRVVTRAPTLLDAVTPGWATAASVRGPEAIGTLGPTSVASAATGAAAVGPGTPGRATADLRGRGPS